MTQSFADSFGWIQKSENLRLTLDRAYVHARNMSHKMVMLEHLLLALIEDYDAQLVFQACKIELNRLNADVSRLMQTQFGELVEPNAVPVVSEAFQKVLTHAVAAGEQSRRPHIDGAIVLAALIGEGSSPAAEILKLQGMTFDETINNLGRTNGTSQSRGDIAYGRRLGNGNPAPKNLTENHAYHLDSSVEDILTNVRDIIGVERSGNQAREKDPSLQAASASSYSGTNAVEPLFDEHRSQGQLANGNSNGNGQIHSLGVTQNEHRVSTHVSSDPSDRGYAVNQQITGTQRSRPMFRDNPDVLDYRSPQNHQPQIFELDSIIHTGQLIETISRRMRTFVKETVEVRIVRADVAEIENNIMGSAASDRRASTRVVEAVTIQLRAPQGGFQIENISPETQWIDNNFGFSDQYANWRWTVTPTRRGQQRLDLVISARQVDSQGNVAENALPEQMVEVRVRSNYLKSLSKVLKWSVAAIIGGGIASYGSMIYQTIIQYM